MKAISWIIILVLLSSVAFGVVGQVSSFYGQSNPFQIDGSIRGNQIYYINFPTAYMNNVTITSSHISPINKSFLGAIYSSYVNYSDYLFIGAGKNIFKILQSNLTNVSEYAGASTFESAITLYNDSIYTGDTGGLFYQFSVNNLSTPIRNFTTGAAIYSDSAYNDSYIYFSSDSTKLYQTYPNLTSVANFTALFTIRYNPVFYKGYIYISDAARIYQLNKSNVSIIYANNTIGDFCPLTIIEDSIYCSVISGNLVYRFNATNISSLIGTYNIHISPFTQLTFFNDSYYIGGNAGVVRINASNPNQILSSYASLLIPYVDDVRKAPFIFNNLIYVTSNTYLTLFDSNLSVISYYPFIDDIHYTNINTFDNLNFYLGSISLQGNFYKLNFTAFVNRQYGTGEVYSVDIGNQSRNTSLNNVTLLNSILSQQCVCNGCSVLNGLCQIPYIFNFTAGSGIVSFNLTNASYSYGINNCSGNNFGIPSNATAMNISFFENTTSENVNYANTINYLNGNYSDSQTLGNASICIYPSWYNQTVTSQIQYIYSGSYYNYFFNDYLNNITKYINLYAQDGSTQVVFTVQDQNTNPVNGSYIYILKYDVGTGTYTTTEILKTDSQGQAIGNIILNTAYYNFLVYYKGALVYTENGVRLTGTTRTFIINTVGTDWNTNYGKAINVITNLSFSNVTGNFRYDFIDPTGATITGCMKVELANNTATTILSNSCATSASGTILFPIPITVSNITLTYTATGYLVYNGNIYPTNTLTFTIAPSNSIFNVDKQGGLFIGIILCLILVLIGIPNPVLSLTFLGIGIIVSSLPELGLFSIRPTIVGSIVILIIIQLFLAGRQTG